MEAFRQYVQKIKHYEEALGVLHWDLRTGAPRKGMDSRSEVIGMLSAEMFKLITSNEMGEFIEQLTDVNVYNELDPITKKLVAESKKEYDRSKKIPAEQYKQYVVLTSQAESAWEEAKEASDFASFQPYLDKIIAYNREFINLWGVKDTPYDTLLDMYEPDMTVVKLDQVFAELKEKLVPLLAQIQQSGHRPEVSFLQQPFDIAHQRDFSVYILKQMGYDFQAGRLDVSAHPFATGLNPNDVRITTNFYPNDLSFSLFSSIHEGGHALYEQNIGSELNGTILSTGTSMGIHESQSRLWENMIGRSRPFWKRYYTELERFFSTQFNQASAEDFYRAINEVKPSFIRIEADELTYNLHVMIRYELEKEIFNDGLQAVELPEAWNQKVKDYLGIVPSNDREGVLQDVHWAAGAFGYFPSYSLGNMYAAQLMNTMQQDLPRMDERIEAGELLPIKQWLSDKIYKHGKMLTPSQIIEHVCGEELDPAYLVKYLEEKYQDIYRL